MDDLEFLKKLADCNDKEQMVRCIENHKPMTNADHIRAMSDEELAAFLDGVQEEECKAIHEVREDGTFRFESLREGWLAWLQQPAEEGT